MTQRFFILSPDTIFTARIDQAAFTYPLGQVTFDGVGVGAFGDIQENMTVLFGSTAGNDDLGRQRIRKAAGAATLYIGRSSQGIRDGEVNLADNAYITVINDRRIWSKIPAMDGSTIYKDHDLAFTDQTEEIPPKANIAGGAVAATIGGGGTITVTFDGSDSYGNAGATISTYAWDVDDGTVTGGAGTDTLTATFPAGYRFVKLTVTDSNGKTDFMEVLVYADDPADSQCVAFQCVEHRVTKDGQSCAFRIMEDIAIADYPDGTMVIFWDGEPSSASDRSNVLFWGWHYSSQNATAAQETGTLKDVVLQCVDGAGKLDTLPAFPQSVEQKTSPTTWLHMAGLNMDLYIDYLFRWHSNAFNLMYYTPSGTGSAFPMVVIGSDGESILDQCQRRAAALVPDYLLTCNRHGELKTVPNPILQDTGDRTAVSQATITAANWTAVSWQSVRPPRYHWIRGSAVLASATEILARFCTAPGQAPGQGLNEQSSGEQLTQSQDDLNACEGHRYAYINAFNGQVVVSLPTDTGIEPAAGTWVTLTVDAAYTRRVLGFSSARGLPIELNITYDYQRTGVTTAVELIWEQETSGTAAVTYVPPDTDWEPPYEPPIEPPDPAPDPTNEGDGFGTVYVLANDVLGRTRDFGAASPAWVDISPSGTYTHRDFILDPWSPTTTGYHLSTDGLHKSTDLDEVTPSWSLVLSEASILSNTGASASFQNRVSCSINIQNYVGVLIPVLIGASGGGDDEIWYAYSTDGGSTWNYSQIVGALATGAEGGSFDIVPHLIGGALTIYAYLDVNNDSELWKSTDSGANWSKMQTISVATGHIMSVVHCPYNDNAAGLIVYFAASDPAASNGAVFKSTDGGSTYATIAGGLASSTATNGVDRATQIRRMGVETYTQDKDRVFLWEEGNNQLYISTTGGSSWGAAAQTGISGTPTAAGGFPYNGQQYYLVTRAGIFVSIDGGDSFVNKTGDWSFGFTAAASAYFDVIVPVWVIE